MIQAASQQILHVKGVSFAAIAPETVVSVGALILLVAGALVQKKHQHLLAIGTVLTVAAAVIATVPALRSRDLLAFDGTVALDGFATFFKLVLLAAAGVTAVVAHNFIDKEDAPSAEFYGLVLFATAGMMLMASAADLLVVFLALETFSIALYVLVAFRRRRLDSQEGALKYFLTGSFSSAFFLYGVALIYASAGTTRLHLIASRLEAGHAHALASAGLALLLVGLGFKVAAFPFHMWTPDAYQGAPAPVTGFMAAGSKVAAFAALLRIMTTTFPALTHDWRPAVIALSIATMTFGSIVAVAQSNVKRMLAYSSIAHAGYLLIGVAAGNTRGISGSLFYLAVYTFVVLGAFALVYQVGRPGEPRVNLDDYRGLWQRRPFVASIFALLLISLAGIPPTAGFWAKFELFSAAIQANQIGLVIAGALTSAIAAFFYLRLIVLMFLESPTEWSTEEPPTAPSLGTAALIAALIVVVAGILPTPLLDFARASTLIR
jgi:NADH-quinone oxidoreductase subunit N